MSTTTTHHAPFHERHDDELLTLSEVAEILMASDNTLRWWRQIGTGPAFFKIGRTALHHRRRAAPLHP